MHASVRAFTVLQYGVCTFSFDPDTRCWTVRPFNFWLFPDPKQGADGVFGCQASSLAFLADNGFDFNKCISKGLPFVPAADRARAMERRQRAASRPPIIATSDRDREYVARLVREVTAWLAKGEDQTGGGAVENVPVQPSFSSQEKIVDGPALPGDLVLEPTNSFLRAMTYQHLEQDHLFGARSPPGFVSWTSREFPDGVARVCLLYTSPSPRDATLSRMPSSA